MFRESRFIEEEPRNLVKKTPTLLGACKDKQRIFEELNLAFNIRGNKFHNNVSQCDISTIPVSHLRNGFIQEASVSLHSSLENA